MKAVKIVLVVLLIAALANWIRDGKSFSLLESLPIIGGYEPGIYDVGGIVMVLIALWGVDRIRRRG